MVSPNPYTTRFSQPNQLCDRVPLPACSWALGVFAYELLAGGSPFKAEEVRMDGME